VNLSFVATLSPENHPRNLSFPLVKNRSIVCKHCIGNRVCLRPCTQGEAVTDRPTEQSTRVQNRYAGDLLGDGLDGYIVVAKNSTVRLRNVSQAASDVFIGEGTSDLNQSGSSVHDTVRESDTVSVALPMNGNENDERENVLLNEVSVGLPALFTMHSNSSSSSSSDDVTSAAAPSTTNDVDNITKKRFSFLS
jgi:hypothetical protein